MNTNISQTGIEKAIEALGYRNKHTAKYRLVHSLLKFYSAENAVSTLEAVDAGRLISSIWGETADIHSKRKNLNSLKTSVNADLMRCFENGTNPEGIVIGPANTFAMSDAAKDKFLGSFNQALSSGETLTLEKIAELTERFGEFIKKVPDPEILQFFDELLQQIAEKDMLKSRDKLKKVIDDVSRGLDDIAEDDGDEVIEEIVVADDDHESDAESVEILDEDASLEEIDERDLEDLATEDVAEDDELVEVDESEIDEVVEIVEDVELDNEDFADEEQRRRLSERFDQFLSSVEQRYNQYLLVPKGQYVVGSTNPVKDELPSREIMLPEIYFGKFPVTNSLFEIFVEQTGYQTTAEKKGYGIVYQGRYRKETDRHTGRACFRWNAAHRWEQKEGAFWYQPNGPGSNLYMKRNHPVVQVSLTDAMAFASWVGKRLPAETEWEAVARTTHGYLYPWGNQWRADLCNTEVNEIADSTRVDAFKEAENELGIADLLGNTLEWTADACDSPHASARDQDYHIARGGSWISDPSITLYSRFRFPRDYSSNILGFRCLAD